MYKHSTSSTIRLTIGTERAGLTYYLSRRRLEQLSSGSHGYMVPTRADDYHLEGSYLLWLDELSLTPAFDQELCSTKRPPRPFVDRVHDWAFRMNPRIEAGHFFNTVEDLWEHSDATLGVLPQLLTMSVAALVYGGLHLLAWNAPFHAPVYGLLWKISGITIASLGVLPILAGLTFLFFIWIDSSDSVKCALRESFEWVLFLMLYVGTILFALLYVFARVYLVVESFLSLAYLPESALTTPNFSLYFPHIG
jgi:hypothetical protein